MRWLQCTVFGTLVLVHLIASLPISPDSSSVQGTLPQQATVEEIYAAEPSPDVTRDKRTIGPLRQLFPGLSEIVDRKLQQIIRILFRVIGRVILRGGILGGGGGGGGGTSSSSSGSTSSGSGSPRIKITLPTYPPLEDDEDEDNTEDTAASNTEVQTALNPEENQLAGAESQQHEVRVQYVHPSPIHDLQAAATGDGEDEEDSEVAASSNEDADAQESEDPRNKRFLPFNFGASASGSAGGGSGNFLFDLLRSSADHAARAVGTVYRVVAGTDDLGLGVSTSSEQRTTTRMNQSTTTKTNNTARALVTSSSGNTDSSDESHASLTAGVEAGVTAGKGDGYEPGIPGPVTRLLVIANRGIANLIQDLILRLAQTSERIVNFKARLITSII